MKYISESQLKTAAKLWKKGVPMAEIARNIGSSPSGIEQALKRNGFTERPKPIRGGGHHHLNEKKRKDIVKLYKQRIPMKEIQTKYKIGPHTIYSILRQFGEERNGTKQKKCAEVGAKHKNSTGYISVKVPSTWPWRYEMAGYGDGSWKLEHRVIMANFLGRALQPTESIHHKNGDKTDNRIENLQLISGSHIAGQAIRCRSCGSHEIEFGELC